ncbi:MAG: carboxypeptidase-like regulatory domain-containing protein [Acidobacteriota bacterium]|nr:carboxypeptidase-like regulatory domain-containing protein [Acidobacteriota bacterium]MDH3785404.1 carboxypeptidase-like regulatory domain-containing protein [Acidobacteriota bacterium]
MNRRASWSVAILFFVVATTLPAMAEYRGHVYDENDQPLPEASVCYLVPGGIDGICAMTDERGLWGLPDSELKEIRIKKRGYLPQVLSAVARDKPVKLFPSATLKVRVRDAATGEGLDGSTVNLLFASGRRHGPFFPNDKGLTVRTLRPGIVRVMVSADGYALPEPREIDLVAAEETEVIVELWSVDAASSN